MPVDIVGKVGQKGVNLHRVSDCGPPSYTWEQLFGNPVALVLSGDFNESSLVCTSFSQMYRLHLSVQV